MAQFIFGSVYRTKTGWSLVFQGSRFESGKTFNVFCCEQCGAEKRDAGHNWKKWKRCTKCGSPDRHIPSEVEAKVKNALKLSATREGNCYIFCPDAIAEAGTEVLPYQNWVVRGTASVLVGFMEGIAKQDGLTLRGVSFDSVRAVMRSTVDSIQDSKEARAVALRDGTPDNLTSVPWKEAPADCPAQVKLRLDKQGESRRIDVPRRIRRQRGAVLGVSATLEDFCKELEAISACKVGEVGGLSPLFLEGAYLTDTGIALDELAGDLRHLHAVIEATMLRMQTLGSHIQPVHNVPLLVYTDGEDI